MLANIFLAYRPYLDSSHIWLFDYSPLNADAKRMPAAARSYATLAEKNRFDDERELQQALQIHLAHQK